MLKWHNTVTQCILTHCLPSRVPHLHCSLNADLVRLVGGEQWQQAIASISRHNKSTLYVHGDPKPHAKTTTVHTGFPELLSVPVWQSSYWFVVCWRGLSGSCSSGRAVRSAVFLLWHSDPPHPPPPSQSMLGNLDSVPSWTSSADSSPERWLCAPVPDCSVFFSKEGVIIKRGILYHAPLKRNILYHTGEA